MTFKEMQDAVLTDRFSEDKRKSAKDWINYRYGRVWASDDWTFKWAVAQASFPQGAQSIPLGDFSKIISVLDTRGTYNDVVKARRPEDFFELQSNNPTRATQFTVINNELYLEYPSLQDAELLILGELAFKPLADDNDEPELPEEFHRIIVHGAISEGLRSESDPTWQAEEQDYTVGVDDMRKSYLAIVRGTLDEAPAWP